MKFERHHKNKKGDVFLRHSVYCDK